MLKRKIENVLEVSKLNTWYGDKKILSDINLSVSRNEIMVIMGHSGSGKSTLLRYILGLEKTKEGLIKLLGSELAKLNKNELYELRKRIGVAFQSGALFSSMTVGENIQLPLHENTNLDENHECSGPLYERADIEMLDLEPEEIPHEIQACIDRRKLEGYSGPYMSDEDCVCCSDMLQEGASIELAVGVLR